METALGKVVKFDRNRDADFEKYLKAVANDDVVTACLYYGDLKHTDLPKLFLIQSVLFSKTRRLVEECQCLVKMLTFEKFAEFNISFVIDLLGMFFRETISENVTEYYVSLLQKRAEVSNQKIQPRIRREKPKLRFVDESDGFFEVVEINDLIVSRKFDDALARIEKLDKKNPAFEHAKIKQAYIYSLIGDDENFENLLRDVYEKHPEKKQLLTSLLSMYGGGGSFVEKLREEISDESDKTSSIFLKTDALIKRGEFEKAREMLDKISGLEAFFERTITSYIECFYGMKDHENLKKYMRRFYLLSNGNSLLKRYVRIVERKNFTFDAEKNVFNLIFERAKSELERETVKLLGLTDQEFAGKKSDEIEDCLNFCAFLKKSKYLTQILDKILRLRSDGFLLIRDKLIDIKLGDNAIYSMLVAVLSNIVRTEFFVLFAGKLKKIKTKYPSLLLDEFGSWGDEGQPFNIQFLRFAYAESFVYNVYTGHSNDKICKQGENVFKRIQNLPQSKIEIFENKNVISAVMCSLDFLDDIDKISKIASDFSLSKVVLVKVLRILEYID